MKWIEIIELRTGSASGHSLEKILNRLGYDLKSDPDHPEFMIYVNHDLESDLSIHLIHSSDEPDVKNSALGYQIASMLKSFGLVSHTIWKERKSNKEEHYTLKDNE